jgi:hypothetical protein
MRRHHQGEGLYHQVEVQNISLGGIKVFLPMKECAGKDVLVTVESLRAIKGTIRWAKDGMMGIVFHQPLSFEELAEWLGKRIEVASLRASTQVDFSLLLKTAQVAGQIAGSKPFPGPNRPISDFFNLMF